MCPGARLTDGLPRSQFTREAFTNRLARDGIRIGMDGRGRVLDNIFVKRLWHAVDYEEIYLNESDSNAMAQGRPAWYFEFCHRERIHQSLDHRIPAEIYLGVSKPVGAELRSA